MEPRIEEVASDVTSLRQYVISLENGVGPVSVFAEGELEKMRGSSNVWLTLHDAGNSYQQFVAFNQQEDMNEARQRSLFLHVSLPGQHAGAEDLTAFPDLDTLGLTLVNILDFLRIKQVLVLGVGAGANIALRFAAKHPTKLHGLVLISPSAGESAGKKHWDIVKTNVFRKTSKVTKEALNAKNVAKYAAANKDRTDMLPVVGARVTCKVLVISRASKVEAGEAIMREITNGNCEFIKLDGDKDPMIVATRRVAEAVVHFAQGLGLVPNATKRKTSRSMSTVGSDSASLVSTESQGEVVAMVGKKQGRKTSMQEADMPNIRRLSLESSHQI